MKQLSQQNMHTQQAKYTVQQCVYLQLFRDKVLFSMIKVQDHLLSSFLVFCSFCGFRLLECFHLWVLRNFLVVALFIFGEVIMTYMFNSVEEVVFNFWSFPPSNELLYLPHTKRQQFQRFQCLHVHPNFSVFTFTRSPQFQRFQYFQCFHLWVLRNFLAVVLFIFGEFIMTCMFNSVEEVVF